MKNLTDLEVALKLEEIKREEAKQETIEEVDENKRNLYYYKQVMNPYSVEEYSHTAYEKGFIEGYQESTKWQQARSYSEEEVKTIINDIVEKHCAYFEQKLKDDVKLEWFKQFKKK